MTPLKVLLTNFELSIRGGTQLYVRDVAIGLLRRGHTPIVYSPILGDVAWELIAATVPVVDDLGKVTLVPDVIHGQHNHELMTALLRFPGVPAVRLCHGWADEAPHPFPRVLRYVAVDDTTRDRCLSGWGIPEDRLEVLLNFVDLDLFSVRQPLPPAPTRALVFSNTARGPLAAVRDACAAAGVAVDVAGHDTGRVTTSPGRLLRDYDLVFAKARAAIEAIASGTAVILCDRAGVGPMVTSANVARLQRLNFGIRTLEDPISREAIAREIRRYDPVDARMVTDHIRATAAARDAIDALVGIYHGVVAEYAGREVASGAEDLRAAAAYLQRIGPRLRWAENPRALRYLVLRSLSRGTERIPGLARIMRSTWAQGLLRDARARWRARESGSP